ncbi:WhiB family transcriptional regulator [Mycolicibacterium sp. P9-64]|nr:WhiB family transcriptional regulator [Mycolicibacterium sp. P9-64]
MARCRTADPSLFFHPDGERGHARHGRQRVAKQICAECPVLSECRDHSIVFEEPFGTWGGLTEEERGTLLPARVLNIRTHRGDGPVGQEDTPPPVPMRGQPS